MVANPKLTIIRDRAWLDYLHTQPCILTGQRGTEYETVDPAHIGAYRGMKRSDDEVLPLLHSIHASGHQKGEMSLFRERLSDVVLREALRAYARQCYREWKACEP